VLNASFSNISAISWRPVLVVEEAAEYVVHLILEYQKILNAYMEKLKTHVA
jgi:hypothetical protein